MSPLLTQALRSFAAFVCLVAVALALWVEVLPALGIIGPSTDEQLAAAAAAIETARTYGAQPGDEPLRLASERLDEARRLAAGGQGLKARRGALAARELAVAAQRSALVRREEDRRRSRRVVEDVDALVNGLEDLHSELARGADREALSRMLPVMKQARAAGAAVVLAFEEGNFARVLEEEAAAKAALEKARAELGDAARVAR